MTANTNTQHTCPYAAALSDDETSQNSPPHGSISPDQLSMARSKCPAFANACPFKDAADNPDKLRDIMKTVPASHFPKQGESSSKTGFQLAMEHIHTVSGWLGATKKEVEGEQYIIQGGCPFKSFHKNHSASSEKKLVVAMEEYSLAAIMGQLGASFDEDDAEQEGEEVSEESLLPEESDPKKSSVSNAQEIDGVRKTLTSQASTLSQALKSGTAESHTAAENVHFVKNFIKGIIDRELYMELVTGLYHTYLTLEKLLDLHGPVHFPSLHFPKELSRVEALREDMEFWYGIDWESKPECRTPSPAVKDYIERMEEVGQIDPMLLLSHAYTRYLGDLSGGKVLSRIARRALKLDGDNGLQFYKFDSISSYKAFKDQYRDALDNLALTPEKVGRLVAEANVAFALNMRVFEELDVSGAVPGARVRNVREALVYYDREIEEQTFNVGEEAKCPFGFTGGSNPLDIPSVADKTKVITKKSEADCRCPWPFVLLHDPQTFMKDWQTWAMIGLILCWGISKFQ